MSSILALGTNHPSHGATNGTPCLTDFTSRSLGITTTSGCVVTQPVNVAVKIAIDEIFIAARNSFGILRFGFFILM